MLSKYQKGLSPAGVLIVVLLFAFFLVSGLKLTPHYIDYRTLKIVYQNVNDQPKINDMSPNEILAAISKGLSVNTVENFDIKNSTVISKETGRMQVGFDYEKREHLFGNINVVLTFEFMPE